MYQKCGELITLTEKIRFTANGKSMWKIKKCILKTGRKSTSLRWTLIVERCPWPSKAPPRRTPKKTTRETCSSSSCLGTSTSWEDAVIFSSLTTSPLGARCLELSQCINVTFLESVTSCTYPSLSQFTRLCLWCPMEQPQLPSCPGKTIFKAKTWNSCQ